MKWIALLLSTAAAVLLWGKYDAPSNSIGNFAGTALATKSRTGEEPLKHREIVLLGPEGWRERFEAAHPDLPLETRDDILQLSASLQEFLANGGDPKGEDARVFGDAIRSLLEHREEEE